ncbi:MAG: [Lachnospiraceae bacterium]|nr:[FeFe] hydrogenase H-cluster maturation GTPase HydF [Lachnospiraceae bacterium]
MSMNSTPNGERFRIGIFGCVNSGKSSLINALTGQDIAMVSDVRGTTTDPVSKAMEMLPIGPVLITDTPGLDDESELAERRIERTMEVLSITDLAILVVDANRGLCKRDEEIISLFKKEKCPYLTVFNKTDLTKEDSPNRESLKSLKAGTGSFDQRLGADDAALENTKETLYVSALLGDGIDELKRAIASFDLQEDPAYPIVADFVSENDTVVLVVPIDDAAPKGRLILPQQQTIRELIEAGAFAVTVRDTHLEDLMQQFEKTQITPSLVVTDSQAFAKVAQIVPSDMRLTSFSILMARHKGILKASMEGIKAIKGLKDGDRVMISEGCTHRRMCGDIGTVKIPRALKKINGSTLEYVFSSGGSFGSIDDLKKVSCVIHCGGCMLSEKEMKRRYKLCERAGVPITNYGLVLAAAGGILDRSIDFIPYE